MAEVGGGGRGCLLGVQVGCAPRPALQLMPGHHDAFSWGAFSWDAFSWAF